MFPTPKKTIVAVTEGCRSLLSEPVLAVGMLMPRSALTPGQSGRDVKHLMKQPVAVAVTPTSIHVIPYKVGAYSGKVTLMDQLASWPRAGVRVVRGEGVAMLQNQALAVGVQQNLIGLQFPDGHAVTFSYTPLGASIRELEEAFVQELSRDASATGPPEPETPAGPAFTP
jgi:hypothetical protein